MPQGLTFSRKKPEPIESKQEDQLVVNADPENQSSVMSPLAEKLKRELTEKKPKGPQE